MLINFFEAIRKHNMKITGVIHVGAHYGQELGDYEAAGIKNIIFIEPCSETFEILKQHAGNKAILFNCACGEAERTAEIHREQANTGMSNSLLKPAKHLEHYPNIQFIDTEVVNVKQLDCLPFHREKYNLLVMDVQGYEANVLKGAIETLPFIDYVYTEINTDSLYEDCARVEDLDVLLNNFDRVETKLTNKSWGDAIYKRKSNSITVPSIFQQRELKHYPTDNNPPFEEWFLDNYNERYNKSDRIYLPILWTEYFKYNNFGKHLAGMQNLQNFLNKLDRTKKYFTIVQYDDGILSDISHLDIKVIALGCKGDFQLPLLCRPHGRKQAAKNILANFIGRNTHPIREHVFKLKDKEGYYITQEQTGIDAYTHIIASSVFTLCPRGYGKTSFRIAEALEQGSIPVYISDEFLQPSGFDFTNYGIKIRQDDFERIDETLRKISDKEIEVLKQRGNYFYNNFFSYGSAYGEVISYLNTACC